MPFSERKYKITLHFAHQDDFLEGFNVEVKSTDPVSALREFLDYEKYITVWKNKVVCINFKNISYAECEEVEE